MRILFWSNAPFLRTGYGKQIRGLIEHLQPKHQFAVVCNVGLSGASLDWHGVTLFGSGEDPLARDVVGLYAKSWNADVVISLYDVWKFPDNIRTLLDTPWIAWTPVDGSPVTPQMIRILKYAEYVVAFSHFGLLELQQAGIEHNRLSHLPLGIDCDVFKPGDKAAARMALNFPADRYIVTMVAANKGYPARKGFPVVLKAFKQFQRDYPDAMLYLHTTRTPMGSLGAGMYFDRIIESLGLKDVVFPPLIELLTGVPDEEMALIYQASDVLLNPSLGEGFCLPVVEAQACGTPVITTANSALSENTVNGIATLSSTPVLTQMGYWWYAPEVGNVLRALKIIRETDQDAIAGVEWAKKEFHWNAVAAEWDLFLECVKAELW
jgi:glycosyltransferase involved in cell wall biosynthesis